MSLEKKLKKKKKAAIFDNEWVIVKNDWDNVAKKVSKLLDVPLEDGKEYKERLKNYSNNKDNPLYKWNRGEISKKRFWSGVLEQYSIPSTKENINKISSTLEYLTTEADQDVLKILNDLKKAGHPLYMLSNSTEEIEKGNKERHNYFNIFDEIYYSHKTGTRKPESKSYLNVLKENKLDPENCTMIDDKIENLKGAENMGIEGIEYKITKSSKRLRNDLISKGYNITPEKKYKKSK
jgi:HAD superfamily hydrolase (TIGR01509 family)